MSKKLLTLAAFAIGALGLVSVPSLANAGIASAGANIAESGKMSGVIKVAQRHNRRVFRRAARHNRRAFRRTVRHNRRVMRRSFRRERPVIRRAYRPNRRIVRRYARINRPVVRRYYRGSRIWRHGPRYGYRSYWPRWSYGYYGIGAGIGSGLYLANRYSYGCDEYYDYASATGSAFWWRQYDLCVSGY